MTASPAAESSRTRKIEKRLLDLVALERAVLVENVVKNQSEKVGGTEEMGA